MPFVMPEPHSHSVAVETTPSAAAVSMSSNKPYASRGQSMMELDFGAYLLSSSPPVNFAFSYAIRDCPPASKFSPAHLVSNGTSKSGQFSDCNGNSLKHHHEQRVSRWSADMSDIRVPRASPPQSGLMELSPSLRRRKNGCAMFENLYYPQNNKHSNRTVRSCLRSRNLYDNDTNGQLNTTTDLREPSGSSGERKLSNGCCKKVSFADDIGRRLYVVRIFEETPDVPSMIDPTRVLNRASCSSSTKHFMPSTSAPAGIHQTLLKNATTSSCPNFQQEGSRSPSPAFSDCSSSEMTSSSDLESGGEEGGREKCILVPNFSMPAASYESFRRKIEENCVSLETVHQVESTGNLWGRVKVKEIAYEKQVFVRVTYNNWESYEDVECEYVLSADSQSCGRTLRYATFSFLLKLPKDLVQVSKCGVQFAVSYRAEGKEYWDNNNFCNYEFTAPDWARTASVTSHGRRGLLDLGAERERTSVDEVFRATETGGWGSYASWTDTDNTVPYW